MKTALDASVLLDMLGADSRFGRSSREALRHAYDSGALVACEVVWAEVRAHFPTEEHFTEALALLGVRYDPMSAASAALAGHLWRERRKSAGAGRRERVVADFLIGAHAQEQADALLTRDRGFYGQYFSRLNIIEPE